MLMNYLDVSSRRGLTPTVEFWTSNNIAIELQKVSQIQMTVINLGAGVMRYVIPCGSLSINTNYLFRIGRTGM